MKHLSFLFLFALSAFGQGVIISPAIFSGSGLNDATSGGRYTSAPISGEYLVVVASVGSPDAFTWSKDGGSMSSPVSMTGSFQILGDGVQIRFAATTGHTAADQWRILTETRGSIASSSFAGTGAGAMVRDAQSRIRETISVRDYTKGDGVSIDTVGFQRALSGARGSVVLVAAVGASIYIPPIPGGGCYQVDQTIVVEAFEGVEIYGAGWSSCIKWVGAAGGRMFWFKGAFQPRMHDLHLIGMAAHSLSTFLYITHGNNSTAHATSTWAGFRDLWLDGPDGGVADPIFVDAPTTADNGNNDFMNFDRIRVTGFTDAAALLVGSQSYSHRFTHCFLSGYYFNGADGFGSHGIKAVSRFFQYPSDTTATGGAASFTFSGGSVTNTSVADFYINGYSAFPYVISDFDDETPGMLLQAYNGLIRQIFIRPGRYGWTPTSTTGGDIIHVEGGDLEIDGLTPYAFGGVGTGIVPIDQSIYWTGGTLGHLTIKNTRIVTSFQTLATVLTGAGSSGSSRVKMDHFGWLSLDNLKHGWYDGESDQITAATWSSGIATFTHTIPDGVGTGNTAITGVSPSGYNVSGVFPTVLTSTTFSVPITSNPGAYMSGGSVTSPTESYTSNASFGSVIAGNGLFNTLTVLTPADVLSAKLIRGFDLSNPTVFPSGRFGVSTTSIPGTGASVGTAELGFQCGSTVVPLDMGDAQRGPVLRAFAGCVGNNSDLFLSHRAKVSGVHSFRDVFHTNDGGWFSGVPSTVSTLSSPVAGALAFVSDSTTSVIGGITSGGGSTPAYVMWDVSGGVWRVIGTPTPTVSMPGGSLTCAGAQNLYSVSLSANGTLTGLCH